MIRIPNILRLCLLALAAGLGAAAAEPGILDLQERFSKPAAWNLTPNQFLAQAEPYGFTKGSERGETVSAQPLKIRDLRTGTTSDYRPRISFLGHPLSDAEIRYSPKTGRPWKITATFYNRGDDGANHFDEAGFLDLRNRIGAALDALLGQRPAPRSADIQDLGIDRQCYLWRTEKLSYILESSLTRRGGAARPEYLKIVMVPPGSLDAVLRDYTQPAQRLTPAQLKEKVRKDRNGDTWIDSIPMVNQGNKGYCSCAVVARILQYYGRRSMTMHDVAQATDTDSRTGTDLNEMIQALGRLGPVLRISVRTFPEFCVIDQQGLMQYLLAYNAAAEQTGVPGIDIGRLRGMIDFNELQRSMDKPALRASRTTSTNLKDFRKTIAGAVDAGTPLIWGVTLGLVREPAAALQKEGGHMRLIIGYNRARDEVIYSDTWGEGHEKKSMAVADAVFITNNLLTVLPYETPPARN